jgi:hypothetical protein
VRAALGAPPEPPGFAWHDESSLGALFAGHGMTVEVQGPHELVVSASRPKRFLEPRWANHPLAVAGSEVLDSAACGKKHASGSLVS